ncbi:putative UDP-glucosyltransferase [Hibiscus syriacus]|uniref:UDP-glucosyltransferase n=1 Tax=Hibiscus syriacus TaxID=106335 RepID=A0A6A3C4K3_HIBSY|nr:putative UDP-glucosyltransferase [Hibiscus syriacus]
MFTTSMIDVANQLGIPCYLFFASPACFLGFMFHLPELGRQLTVDFVDLLPTSVLKRNKDGYFWYLEHACRYDETMGIVVNTFLELEPHAIDSLSFNGVPPAYPVGPIIDHAGAAQWHPDGAKQDSIMKWLDDQPPSSVVFLCFGSMGSLEVSQLREIAFGLEHSGYRFLWSIRKPPEGKLDLPGEYTNVADVLPLGFLDRTAGLGLVCGWVQQVRVLSHQAIGGFVSHCGSDYRDGSDLVASYEFERELRRLMDGEDEVKAKIKEMKIKSRWH